MTQHLRSAPWWALPFLGLSLVVAIAGAVLLAGFGVIAVFVIGIILVGQSLPGMQAEYQRDPPTKSWDAPWGWLTFGDLPRIVRAGLVSAGLSVTVMILAIGTAGESSAEFAWGLLVTSALLAGVESLMRHRRYPFLREAAWVCVEALVFLVVALASAQCPIWVLGVAAACALEVSGFFVGVGAASSRVGTAEATAAP